MRRECCVGDQLLRQLLLLLLQLDPLALLGESEDWSGDDDDDEEEEEEEMERWGTHEQQKGGDTAADGNIADVVDNANGYAVDAVD